MPNILKRAITGFFILALYLPLLIFSQAFIGFFLLNTVLSQIAVFELSRVFRLNQNKAKNVALHVLVLILSFATTGIYLIKNHLPIGTLTDLTLSIYLLTLVLTLVLANLVVCLLYFKQKTELIQAHFLVNFLALSFGGMVFLRSHRLLFALFPLSTTILTDTFAYLGGITLGRHKMTKISPKKSWEGFFIGTIFAAAATTAIYFLLLKYYYFEFSFFNLSAKSHPGYFVLLFLIAFLFGVIAQGGDLIFSAFKRKAEIKDYSQILPGHGGVLDRMDALSVTTFLSYLVLLIFVVMQIYFLN